VYFLRGIVGRSVGRVLELCVYVVDVVEEKCAKAVVGGRRYGGDVLSNKQAYGVAT